MMTRNPTDEVFLRCAAGAGCREVVDRLVAADAARALGEVEQADRLRQAALRWAEAHGRGGATRADERVAS